MKVLLIGHSGFVGQNLLKIFFWHGKKKFKCKIKFKFGNKRIKKYEPPSFWGSTKKLKKIFN